MAEPCADGGGQLLPARGRRRRRRRTACCSAALSVLLLGHRPRVGAAPAALAALECDAVALALDACQAALAGGATELGVAQLQVLLEYTFFAPEGE